jgi:hypothetical protein
MELSQAVNNPGISTDVGTSATFLGLSGSQVFWAVVVLAVLLLAFWWLSGYRSNTYVGQKGGRVKKTVEYDEEDEDDL